MAVDDSKVEDYLSSIDDSEIPSISVEELESVIRKGSGKSSPGDDYVTYELMKLFGKRTLEAISR
jgi:hypothetical protein